MKVKSIHLPFVPMSSSLPKRQNFYFPQDGEGEWKVGESYITMNHKGQVVIMGISGAVVLLEKPETTVSEKPKPK